MNFSSSKLNSQVFSQFIVSLDSIRYSFLTALLLSNKTPILIAGDIGIGKSVLISYIIQQVCQKNGLSVDKSDSILGKIFMFSDKNQNLLESLQNLSKYNDTTNEDDSIDKRVILPVTTQTYTSSEVKFNSQTSAERAIEYMTSKMVKRGQGIIGPPKNKKMILFVDDLHIPTVDEFGSQSTLEMVRQWVELNGFYDNTSMTWTYLMDTNIIATCSPNYHPGISERLTKNFCILTLPQPSINALQRIFQVKIGRYFQQKDFNAEVKSQLHNMVSAPISLFFKVNNHFKNSPQKSHYIFNLRALHKVIQSIYMADDKVVNNKEEIGNFLAHEMTREFHDRLISDSDRQTFYKILSDELHMYFKINWSSEDLIKKDLMFGQFFPHRGSSSTAKVYQNITDKQKLKRLFQDIINSYQSENKNINQFIFFKQSIEHVVRIIRVINQNSGHMLLIGMEGCGKYSNVKISTAIFGCELSRLCMTADYNNISFGTDIKKIISKSVLQNRHCVVYLSDVDDLVTNSFMDNLCCLINSGNIPDLYENDELESVLSHLKKDDLSAEESNDPRALYDQLIQKINQYLHIFIGLSPINPNHRSRLRNNPNLINCCTIDWYDTWRAESLYSVAHHKITDIINGSNMTFDNKSEVIQNLVEGCSEIFNSSMLIGSRFHLETRRPYFLSSGDFIEYLNVFSEILQNNYSKNLTNKNRLLNGLNQLTETKMLIAKMKENLIELQPKIKEKNEETEKLLTKLETDKKLVSEIEDIVKDEEEIIKLETEAVEKYSKECEEDLKTAIPILNSAIEALDSLDKSSISEVRVYRNPPRIVEMVMSAVCVLMNVSPSWPNAKLLLNDSNFINKLLNYDKEKITKKIHKELQAFISHKDFNTESVGYVSVACKSICQWVLAVYNYYAVNNMVIPKRKNVEEANSALELSRQKLSWKHKQLKKVEDHLTSLDQKYQHSLDEQKDLKERERLTNERLVRAAALIDALQSEKDRWNSGVEEYDESIKYILGSCVISAAYTSFTGPWTTFYREEACNKWISLLDERNIPISKNYKFIESEYSAYEVLNWHNNGLPRDKSMAENVAIMDKSQKWSLLIDPQKQGKQFLQFTYNKSFRVVSCKQKDYIVTLERAIRVGDVLCLEDFETSIDPVLGPLLRKEIFYKSNIMTIRLGENELEYSPSFKLFLMTSLSNPQLESSVSRLVSIINFTVNMIGLQEQLLSLVVSKERPEVEQERNRLLRTYATDLKSLRELEDRTLGLLQESTEQIVNDSELAVNLEMSKVAAIDIKRRLEETIEAEKQLKIAREFYLPLAIRGAQIYFVLADLSAINYMYQFSLAWFQNVFIHCLNSTNNSFIPLSEDLIISEREKLESIIDDVTLTSYNIASYGLFGMHKPLLSFMLATTIMRYVNQNKRGAISQTQWLTFIKLHTTSSVYGENIDITNNKGELLQKPSDIEWLSSEIWNKCKFLESELKESFSGLCSSLCYQSDLWVQWNAKDNIIINSKEVFGDFSMMNLKSFDKIILLSILSLHKLIESILIYVKEVLGDQFSSFSENNLMKIFTESPSNIPLIFVLGRNSDPMNHVVKLVTELRGSISHLDVVSMGRGQASKAETLLQKTNIHKGRWIFLQNCDLMISWMPYLQKLVETLNLNKKDSDPNFRLIISTHPHCDFPLGILQNSLKIAMESPVGIKNQILKSFSLDGTGHVTSDQFDNASYKMKKMIFNLCLFNAAVLERKHYGCLGFSLPYDFNDSDLEISIKQLPSFLTNDAMVHWEALHNIIGHINYSGRITESLDCRCLLSLLQKYETDEALNDGLKLILKSEMSVEENFANFNSLNKYLRSAEFVIFDLEAVLGLGGNAEIVRKENQSKSFIYDIVVQQSKHHDSEANDKKTISKTIIAMDILKILSNKVPKSIEDYNVEIYGKDSLKTFDPAILPIINIGDAIKDDLARFNKYHAFGVPINKFFDSSLHNVLVQEINQYNNLLDKVHRDMIQLTSFLLGERNITENLEAVLDEVCINMVPSSWGIISTGKSLSEWCMNIRMRIDFIAFWSHCVLSEYYEYLDLIYRTAKDIGEKNSTNNEKINPLKYECEALKILFKNELPFSQNRSISCYWLPGFFSPQRFMTAVMQNEARKIHLSIDSVEVSLRVLPYDHLVNIQKHFTQDELLDVSKSLSVSNIISQNDEYPDHGVYIFGLYLDNAVWDVKESVLTPNSNHRRFCKLPMVHLLPVATKLLRLDINTNINIFQCPLYKTPARFGVLSSSGKSSNFICFIDLNSKQDEHYWILRGAAALLQYEIE